MSKFIDNFDRDVQLHFKSDEIITLIINKPIVNIDYEFLNGNYSLLIYNNTNSPLEINEKGKIINSQVTINYLDLNDFELKQNCLIDVYKDSELVINTTYLGTNNKKIDFKLVNQESNSNIQISNNVVCLDNSVFNLKVNGKIIKGSKNCKTHQKSRCLTIGNPKEAKILPILEIDENDVEASHSLSMGTIDKEILFYMNSRGLSNLDALKLILTSYLMPSEDFYKDYPNGLEIKESAEGKVSSICSM